MSVELSHMSHGITGPLRPESRHTKDTFGWQPCIRQIREPGTSALTRQSAVESLTEGFVRSRSENSYPPL